MRRLFKTIALVTLAWLFDSASPAPLSGQTVSLTRAWTSLSKSLPERTQSRNFGPSSLLLTASGSFAEGGDPTIVCSARVFDGTTSEGFGRRRKGVRLRVRGELIDGSTGATLEVLSPKTARTNKNGEAKVELPIGPHDNFHAALSAEWKKKRLTSATITCSAEPASANTSPLGIESPPVGTTGHPWVSRSAGAAYTADTPRPARRFLQGLTDTRSHVTATISARDIELIGPRGEFGSASNIVEVLDREKKPISGVRVKATTTVTDAEDMIVGMASEAHRTSKKQGVFFWDQWLDGVVDLTNSQPPLLLTNTWKLFGSKKVQELSLRVGLTFETE